jgi:hypothetical protein
LALGNDVKMVKRRHCCAGSEQIQTLVGQLASKILIGFVGYSFLPLPKGPFALGAFAYDWSG